LTPNATYRRIEIMKTNKPETNLNLESLLIHMGTTVIIDGRALVLLAIDYVNECFIAFEQSRNFQTLVRFEEVK